MIIVYCYLEIQFDSEYICIALHQMFPLCHQKASFDHLLSKFRCVK